MASVVTTGAQLQCSFGAAPSILNATPTHMVTDHNMTIATVMDYMPVSNIPPFVMCTTQSNPAVAAATAAALGTPTPAPCVPVITAPWAPGSPTVLIGNMPALTDTCKCMCTWGGVISIIPGPPKTNVP